jgi:hypothetical protein
VNASALRNARGGWSGQNHQRAYFRDAHSGYGSFNLINTDHNLAHKTAQENTTNYGEMWSFFIMVEAAKILSLSFGCWLVQVDAWSKC